MSGGALQPTGWGLGGLAAPPVGASYPLLLRGESYAWWRSLPGVLLAPVVWLLLAGTVTNFVVQIAWRLNGVGTDETEYATLAQRYEIWPGMLASHLGIAVGIPLAFVMVRHWHLVRTGYLWSVDGRPRWRFLLASLGVAVVVFSVYIATMSLLGEPMTWRPQEGFWAFLVVILLVTPLQAAAEEFLFRGYLLQGLGSLVANPWFGVLTSALVFALFHGTQNVPLFLSRFVFGVVVGWLVLKTGGLEAAIAAHVINNVFAFILAGLTSTISEARTLTEVGWAQTFSDVITYAIFSLLAIALAVRMGVRRTHGAGKS